MTAYLDYCQVIERGEFCHARQRTLKPEVLIYEPNGDKMTLVGIEYVVIAEQWHAKNELPPVLAGQSCHYSAAPNRYGMPPHYQLPIWAWRSNNTGRFADWNPRVRCGG